MRARVIVVPLVVAAVLLGLGSLLAQTGEAREDLLEFAAISLGVLTLVGALYERGTPRAPKKRAFRRTPDSQW